MLSTYPDKSDSVGSDTRAESVLGSDSDDDLSKFCVISDTDSDLVLSFILDELLVGV